MRKGRMEDFGEGVGPEWRTSSRKLGGNMPDEAAGFEEESLGWSALWDPAALRESGSLPAETRIPGPADAEEAEADE